MEKVIVGSQVKINVHAEGDPEFELKDCDFDLLIYSSRSNMANNVATPCKCVKVKKEDCTPRDNGDYVVAVDTEKIGRGYVIVRMSIDIPDDDFQSGKRHELLESTSGIEVI